MDQVTKHSILLGLSYLETEEIADLSGSFT
jgi:hypothetical protein